MEKAGQESSRFHSSVGWRQRDHHVEEEETAYGVWSKLDTLYASKTAINKVHLIGRLSDSKFQEGKSIAAHLNEFQSIFIQLKNMEITFDDEVQALMVMGSLPKSWETLKVSLSNSAPGGKLLMASVTAALLGEEIRRGDDGSTASTSKSEALMTEGRGRTRTRKQNNYQGKSRSKSRDFKKDKPCHNCGKLGHWKNECRGPKKTNDKSRPKVQHEESETDLVTDDGDLVIVSEWVGACTSTTFKEGEWVIDSGASFHVTPHKEFFSSYTAGNYGHVRMGNKDTAEIVGKGDIRLEMSTGCSLLLKEVRHVPDLRLSLISTGKLDDEGHYSTFGNGMWKLTKGSLVVAKGKKDCSLYKTQAKLCKAQLNTVEGSFDKWHQRLGHMSEKGMKLLCRRQSIPDLQGGPADKCVDCLMGKQHRVSFTKKLKRTTRKLDRVYSDVCGPMKVKSLGGSSYFVTFIDDFSRKLWVYPMKTKDQVLQKFKVFHALVERETGRKLKCMRTDNGGEYIGPFDA